MRHKQLASLIATALVIGSTAIAIAGEKQPRINRGDLGKYEYNNSCALCHGANGKGEGSVLDLLKKAPPDLTTLSKRNNGVFPFERVYRIIDGREILNGHGERDMPAWGDRYTASSEGAKAGE
ncbi:MAG TPA: cytochrome c, partial [Burkholderiales bacterium]|nr:cytochrome c [Burkholderiales bacterium]